MIRAAELRAGDAVWNFGARHIVRDVETSGRRLLVHTDRGTIRLLPTSLVRPAESVKTEDVVPPWAQLLSKESVHRLEQLESAPVKTGPLDQILESADLARVFETPEGKRSELTSLGWKVAAALRKTAAA